VLRHQWKFCPMSSNDISGVLWELSVKIEVRGVIEEWKTP